ncbi:hypothetical protein D3C72_1706350 [compost metagenome]
MTTSRPTLAPIQTVRAVSAKAATGSSTPGVGVMTTALMATKCSQQTLSAPRAVAPSTRLSPPRQGRKAMAQTSSMPPATATTTRGAFHDSTAPDRRSAPMPRKCMAATPRPQVRAATMRPMRPTSARARFMAT